MVLDIDGAILRRPPREGRESPESDRRWAERALIDEDVITALDEQVARPGVRAAWLTTWTAEQVNWLIREPLAGRLAGQYIPWLNWPKRGWRVQSLVSYLRRTGASAVVWVDDRAVDDAEAVIHDLVGIPALVVKPVGTAGVTRADVVRIRAGLDIALASGRGQ